MVRFFLFFFFKSNIITWCKMRFEALLDGDINLQDNVQPINMSVCSLRLSVAGRTTRVSLSSSGCPSSLPLCAHRIFIASLPCYAFCLVMLDSSWALTLFFRLFFFWLHTHETAKEICISEPLSQIVRPSRDQSGPALCVVSSLSEGPFWSCCSELLSPATVKKPRLLFNSLNPIWSF